MYLIQQAELVVDNKFRNNHLTKCTTSTTTTMKQEENHDFIRKNGLNGNIGVAESTTLTQPHSSTITIDQVPIISTVAASNHHAVASGATSSAGRNGDHQIASSTSPHDLTTNNNNALRMNHNNNNNNTNNKKTSSIENGAKPNNNSSNRTKPATITGERLQFFKDGKFILELARAREGDKTGWVSVPRKAYWPPTVSSSTSANFKKHESSASLSCSDDNSSIQSSPWQRDHCWKKTIPRQNISKEMAMFYHRPVKLIKFSKDSLKAAKCKRRRPYNKKETKFTFVEQKGLNIVQSEKSVNSKRTVKHEETVNNGNSGEESGDCVDGSVKMEIEVGEYQLEPGKNVDSPSMARNIKEEKEDMQNFDTELNIKVEKGKTQTLGQNENTASNANIQKKCDKKLDTIVKKLTDRADSGLSRLNHIKTSYQHHVSPRKRILREFEKVSLEDPQTTQKRSRAKTGVSSSISSVFDGHAYGSKSSLNLLPGRPVSPQSTANSRAYPIFSQKISNGSNNNQTLDTHTVTSSGTSSIPVLLSRQHKATSSCSPLSTTAAPLASQSRISSYSITSLLGHESSSSTSFTSNNHIKKETNSIVTSFVDTAPVSPPSTDSRYSSACTPSSSNKKRSPSYGTPSPLNNVANNLHGLEYYTMMRSPDLSPSPEHQIHPSAFPRYRSPSTYSIIHGSSSSPQSYSAGLTPIRSSPSPSNSDSYNPKYKTSYLSESPNHHPYAAVSPSHRYSPIPGYQSRKSPHVMNKSAMHSPTRVPTTSRHSTTGTTSPSLSPTIEEPSQIQKEVLPSPGVRNLPKKTAALRQQFQQNNAPSPPSGSINQVNVRGQMLQKEREKEHELVMKQREAERRAYSSVMHPGIPGLETLGSLPIHGSHPAAASSMYPYMFPPGAAPHNSYLNSSLSSYYQQVYAAAAAYRNPLWMHYPAALAGPPPPHLSVSEHVGAPHSTWPISEHSPSSRPSVHLDESGVLVKLEREESNPDVPLNLSKH